ncbi:hypothetical protein OJF2_28110 [Aquisphaera giovannonii]|uniref:DUF5681 domain-containing protein n=1 Tax=Aquisphaera giovannonii TaxID=406548 RepID=A0A5B9W0X8_9BACT|nr:DUF5681 domain-containing protein [Aquisphaera giovannonii]QEH34276.1 hypothetical protein OJF2_28110 [Aquisphaera giovannonii]
MRNTTSWKPGQSGNPRGRPKALNGRSALRAVLLEPADPAAESPVSRLEQWARGIVEAAVTFEDRLAVLRFLEGNQPPPAFRVGDWQHDEETQRPRIAIPGADVRPRLSHEADETRDDEADDSDRIIVPMADERYLSGDEGDQDEGTEAEDAGDA